MTAREVIIGMLSLAITMLGTLLGLAYRYGKVVNEVKNIAEATKQTAEALDRHIEWHMGRYKP